MKATVDIPDDLYRRVKAKSALRGQPVREVVVELFQSWLVEEEPATQDKQGRTEERQAPAWFGVARRYAEPVQRHDMDSIRRSIARKRERPNTEGSSQTESQT